MSDLSCSHCHLSVGRLGRQRELHGQAHWFCCYGCCLAFQVHQGSLEEPQAAGALIRLGVGAFLAMNIMLFSLLLYAGAFRGDDAWLLEPVQWLLWLLATPLVLLLGGPFAEGAWQALRRGRLGTDALVCIGVGAAYAYSAWQVLRGSPLVYFDTASMVLMLFTLGAYLEAQGRARAARSLAPMLAAERAEVHVLEGGAAQLRAVTSVLPGDMLRVVPGERIAIYGIVVEGHSDCNEAILTGQPQPQAKAPGAFVHAGSLNGSGVLLVRATVAGTQTRWIRISRQVRDALAGKSLAGDSVDRVVAIFIPGVLLLATASAWYWASHSPPDVALLAGLAVLVVACPCSLGLAAPLAHALAIGQAAQRGILIRGGGVLEKLARIRGVAFDKTGTLTDEAFQALCLRVEGSTHEQVLRHATLLARGSDHPVARAVVELGRALAGPAAAADIQAHPGHGLLGRIDGVPAALGSAAFMHRLGWDIPRALVESVTPGGTLAFVAWGGRVHGLVILTAPPTPQAAPMLAALRRRGLQTLLLSGDGATSVQALATTLGFSSWHAALLPEDKVAVLREWSARRGALAMVGDGLNDAAVLAAASVGIAVGHATDLARESADVVLPRSDLSSLPWLLRQADAVRRSVRANLVWAFAYNAVALALAAAGLLQPVGAAALMAGSSLLVALRSWRAGAKAGADGVVPEPAGVPPLRWSPR